MREWISIYTDEHVQSSVVKGLKMRGIDVLTTKEADMLGAEDEAHLKFTQKKKRIIFTQDTDFFTAPCFRLKS